MAFNNNGKEEYIKKTAELFIKGFEKGELPWQKPWNAVDFIPDHNMISEKNVPLNQIKGYQGMNSLLTFLTRKINFNSDDPRWLTFNQMNELNESIKNPNEQIKMYKGSKATIGQYFNFLYYKNGKKIDTNDGHVPKKDEYDKCIPVAKPFFIFHVSQFYKYQLDKEGNILKDENGTPMTKPAFEPLKINDINKIEFKPVKTADEIINNSGAKIYNDTNDRAYYSPLTDDIHTPPKEHFKTIQDYYDTVLHELTHWTGGEKRLNREELVKYNESKEYRAKEELNAEIGGFMLAQQAKINFKPTDNNISYVNSWVSLLKDKPEAIFEACKNASQAVDFLMNENSKVKKITQNINQEKDEIIIEKVKGRTH